MQPLEIIKGIEHVLKNIDTSITAKVSVKQREARNCVSPSLLKWAKPVLQSYAFFNPDVLLKHSIIDEDRHRILQSAKVFDTGGCLNVLIGTFIHETLFPELEKYFKGQGVQGFTTEHPVFSSKYGMFGTADIVCFGENNTIYLYDLKTTGPKILERNITISTDYERQLYAYILCLQEMYPEMKVVKCGIISVCKCPNSYLNKVKLPVTAYYEADIPNLRKKYGLYFADLSIQVRKINKMLKDLDETYADWVLEKDIPPTFDALMDEFYKRGDA